MIEDKENEEPNTDLALDLGDDEDENDAILAKDHVDAVALEKDSEKHGGLVSKILAENRELEEVN